MADNTISILGCGWLGKPLAEHFIKNGYIVKGSTTLESKRAILASAGIEPFVISINNITLENQQFFKSENLIISITSKSIEDFKNLINEIENSTIKNVIFVSSTSVYKKSNKLITEDTTTDLATSPLLQIEKLFLQNSSFKTTVLRFGGLFGYDRKPGNFFKSGKILSDSEAFVNLIHRDDCIKIIEQIIEQDIWNDVFNCCADTHPTKRKFYTKAAMDIGNLPPNFKENGASDYKIISNEKIKKRLNFTFKHNDLMKI